MRIHIENFTTKGYLKTNPGIFTGRKLTAVFARMTTEVERRYGEYRNPAPLCITLLLTGRQSYALYEHGREGRWIAVNGVLLVFRDRESELIVRDFRFLDGREKSVETQETGFRFGADAAGDLIMENHTSDTADVQSL